jgi:predicted  nucleic acid-binding Zn-ribbon protein
MTSSADLFALQEIDLRRDARRALIADIEARLGETEELVAARDRLEEAEAEIERLKRQQRDVDARLEDLDARIRPLETKLYDGSVRNPKELTDLQKEVDSLKARRGKFDDEGLALLDATEAANAALNEAREQLGRIEAYWEADQAELRDEKARAETESAHLDAERNQRTQGMERPAIGLYEVLRPKKAGRAVARVERGACQGCRVTLPTHLVQQVRNGDAIVQCPRCDRILVIG